MPVPVITIQVPPTLVFAHLHRVATNALVTLRTDRDSYRTMMLTMMVYATLMKFWVAPILQPATIWKMQQRTVEHAFCLLIVKHVQEKQMAQVQL